MILFYNSILNFAKQSRKKAPWTGFLTGLYLIGYGTVRFFIEFYHEPDAQLGFVFFNFSMGQVLCFIMIAAGVGIVLLSKPRAAKAGAAGRSRGDV
jgi:phosphatidylglycerol:prolipoprotein diacylglycerol transferase